MKTRGIILAAGRGSRMGELTADQPKCFVELGGRSLLKWQLDALRGAGIEEIAIVTGYLAEAFAGRADRTFHNARWSETNMVQSLLAAREWLSEGPCVISYADLAYEADTVRRLLASPGELVISYHTRWLELWSRRFADPLSDAETFRTDEGGRLLEIGARAKSLDEIRGQYMGLLLFRPEGFREIDALVSSLEPKTADKLDMTSLLSRLIARGVHIDTVPVDGLWFEVDSELDLKLYRAML